MIHLTHLNIGKAIRNNFKINKIKAMSIVTINDFELGIQKFYGALNCSFKYAFSLYKLVFPYRYLKKCVTRYT